MSNEEKIGVKNIIECIDAAFESIKVYKELSLDGLDWSDAIELGSKLIKDEKFRGVYAKAIEGIDKLPAEGKDIDIAEVGLLVTHVISKIQDLKNLK